MKSEKGKEKGGNRKDDKTGTCISTSKGAGGKIRGRT